MRPELVYNENNLLKSDLELFHLAVYNCMSVTSSDIWHEIKPCGNQFQS
jgi:hypothetical protein